MGEHRVGAWGTAIFSDDVACDIRDAYRDLLAGGCSGKEATRRLLDEFKQEIRDDDDGLIFWLALASLQWQYGRLEDRVKAKALKLIDSGVAAKRWTQWAVDPRDGKRRQRVLAKLRQQLCSPQPAPKKIRQPSLLLPEALAKPVTYPFVPKSTAMLEPGQYWSIPLDNGRFACGRVIQLQIDNGKRDAESFLAGLMDWWGRKPPTADRIAGCEVVEQGSANVKTIQATGGQVLGSRDLSLDHIEANLFRDAEFATWVQRGFKYERPFDKKKDATLPVFSGWGFLVIKILAEKRFGAHHRTTR
jgi:hypothetical protein